MMKVKMSLANAVRNYIKKNKLMEELFKNRAKENLKAAELLFEAELFNASASRAYYSAFLIAIAALYDKGLKPAIDHRTVQSLFADAFVNRNKILPSKYKAILYDLHNIRIDADYKLGIKRQTAKVQLQNDSWNDNLAFNSNG